MERVNTPKHVAFGFCTYCEGCPYAELDIVEDMWECGVSTLVTCKNEDICKWVYFAAKEEISEAMEEKEAKND